MVNPKGCLEPGFDWNRLEKELTKNNRNGVRYYKLA